MSFFKGFPKSSEDGLLQIIFLCPPCIKNERLWYFLLDKIDEKVIFKFGRGRRSFSHLNHGWRGKLLSAKWGDKNFFFLIFSFIQQFFDHRASFAKGICKMRG
jgi:hypothetical protein